MISVDYKGILVSTFLSVRTHSHRHRLMRLAAASDTVAFGVACRLINLAYASQEVTGSGASKRIGPLLVGAERRILSRETNTKFGLNLISNGWLSEGMINSRLWWD